MSALWASALIGLLAYFCPNNKQGGNMWLAVVIGFVVFAVASVPWLGWIASRHCRAKRSIGNAVELGGVRGAANPDCGPSTPMRVGDLSVLAVVSEETSDAYRERQPAARPNGQPPYAVVVDPLARLRMWRDFQLQARRLWDSSPWLAAELATKSVAGAYVEDPLLPAAQDETGSPTADSVGPMLMLLGPIRVDGLVEQLTTQQTAVVTLLAVRGPMSRDQLVEAIWSGRVVSASRFANLLAEIRSSLGRDCLLHDSEGRYRVSGVATDVDLLRQSIDNLVAESVFGDDGTTTLVNALSMVTGAVLGRSASKYWRWLDDDYHHVARIQQLAVTAALKLVEVAERSGQLSEAQWACEQGLMAVPGDETLVGRLSEFYSAQGHDQIARKLSRQPKRPVRLDRS